MPEALLSLVRAALLSTLLVAGIVTATIAADAKFETDAALRSGMEAIRTAVINNHTLITHRRFPPPMAAGFASHVKAKVEEIKANARVPDAARKDLDAVLSEIATGASLIAPSGQPSNAMDGLFRITDALEFYAARFDHPGWMPIQER